jgi:hydrogenase/urease accessory protein HupE
MFMQVIFEESSMEIKKLTVLGGLCGASYQAAAHPGHGDSLWEEIVHTLTAADHLPFMLVVGVVLVTGVLFWKRRR